MDIGYLRSDNQPENRSWRSKGTTSKLDRIEANMLRGFLRKDATAASRWGLEFGFQAGVDTDGLVTSPPPPANEPLENADVLLHFSSTTLSYLIDAGNGLLLTGGFLNAYIAYESYFSIDNPNYTRGYLTDYVPYYLLGLQADYPFCDRLTGSLILASGYNYLASPNDVPAYGIQLAWQASPSLTVTQNLYYGPDQSDAGIAYWRFFSDTIAEWQGEAYILAASFDFGTEKQAWLPDEPRYRWASGALWGRLDIRDAWRIGLRPEFYWDPDGLMTRARQTLWAVATTLEYRVQFSRHDDLSVRAEYRFDRSTGEEGGFYKDADNHLVSNQNLMILALTWAFDWSSADR